MPIEPKKQTFQLALFSAFSCLVTELARKEAINIDDLTTSIEAVAAEHRNRGNVFLAQFLHMIAQKLIHPAGPSLFETENRDSDYK